MCRERFNVFVLTMFVSMSSRLMVHRISAPFSVASYQRCSPVLTMHPTKAPVETLRVYGRHVISIGSMKQLPFIISSIVLIHFLLPHHVRLIKKGILNSFDFQNIYTAGSSSNFLQDIFVLAGTWGKFHWMYCHLRVRHWCPVLWKRDSWKKKKNRMYMEIKTKDTLTPSPRTSPQKRLCHCTIHQYNC